MRAKSRLKHAYSALISIKTLSILVTSAAKMPIEVRFFLTLAVALTLMNSPAFTLSADLAVAFGLFSYTHR